MSVFFEAVGFAMVMPLLSSVLEPSGQSGSAHGFFEASSGLTTIELCLLIFLLFLLKTVLGIAKNFLMYDLEWRIRAYWISEIFESALFTKFMHFEREKPGVIYNNLINETLKACSFYRQCMEFFAQVLQVFALSLVMLIGNVKLALVAMALVSVVLLVLRLTIMSRAKDLGAKRREIEEDISQDVNEMVQGMKTIRYFTLEDTFLNRLGLRLQRIVRLMRRTEVLKRLPLQITELSLVVGVCSTIVVAEVAKIDVPQLLPFLGMMFVVSTKLFSSAGSLSTNYMSLKVLLPSAERVSELLAERSKRPDFTSDKSSRSLTNADFKQISFDKVKFSYDADAQIFEDLSVTFDKSKITTIVGRSGSGKSTLVKLLMRLYDPESGVIRVDDMDSSLFDNGEWRKAIGYVDQDAFFFFGTIRENLTLGARSCSEAQMKEALKLAHCDEFISSMPDGIDANIGDRGSLLSGGQRARLALARALVFSPKVLVIDEVTSGLDAVSTEKVIDSLSQIKNEIVVICVTHDDELVRASDNVYRVSSKKLMAI